MLSQHFWCPDDVGVGRSNCQHIESVLLESTSVRSTPCRPNTTKLLMALHDAGHWIALIFDLQRSIVSHFNSGPSIKCGINILRKVIDAVTLLHDKTQKWEIKEIACVKQEGGIDC